MTAAKKIEEIRDTLIQVTNCTKEEELERVFLANGKLMYRLFQSECEVEEQTVLCFGVELICTLFDEEESARVADITTKYEVAKELFDLLCENLVTPVVLKDIVEDFLSDKYSYN